MLRRLVFISALVLLILQTPALAVRTNVAAGSLPNLILWAWERPEDLRRAGADAGVAFLVQTITLSGNRVSVAPRRQALRVSPAAALVAVTRIEVAPSSTAALKPDQVASVAALVAATAGLPRVRGVQVDFDATTSERALYRNLLRDLRQRIDRATPLSITALASWCEGDDWLAELPIDEAVPMLFRMGSSDEPFRRLGRSNEWHAPLCRTSLGVSLDERLNLPSKGRRLYVFSPVPWTDAGVADARRQVLP